MKEPRKADELLAELMKQLGSRAGRRELTIALDDVLGARFAEHCEVVAFRGGKLVVEVDSAPLCAEFRGFRAEEIRLEMNRKLRKRKVAQIKFRMGGTGHV